jgi:serralysin
LFERRVTGLFVRAAVRLTDGLALSPGQETTMAINTQIPSFPLPLYATGTAGADNYVGTSYSDFFQMGVNRNVLDTIDGSKGTDTLSYQNADRGVTVTMGAPGETGHTEADFVTFRITNPMTGQTWEFTETQTVTEFKAVENVIGSRFDDTIIANSADNRLEGKAGNDTIDGGGGADTILAGQGEDDLWGGAGADHFVFTSYQDSGVTWIPLAGGGFNAINHGRDTIHDYESGIDKIDLSGIDANVNQGGNQAFHWVEAFTGEAGELRLFDPNLIGGGANSGNTNEDWVRISGDIDGDMSADFDLIVQWAPSMNLFSQADVIL